MKIKIELYGASKDLSSENIIELKLKDMSTPARLSFKAVIFLTHLHLVFL